MLDEQEKQLLSRFLEESLREKRKVRRWSVFSRLIVVGIVVLVLFFSISQETDFGNFRLEHTALIKVDGPIFADSMASAENINRVLHRAYENDYAKAVVLELNTPGGSPVQAGRIYTTIKHLREKYPDKPLYAVISDICASGGMYIAAAADMIYADHASIVGSIGVIMSGFGFENTLEKLGMERRLMTAGEHKGMLDPFSPQDPKEVRHIQIILDQIHEQFIQRVKQGRGDKLSQDADLFSGLVWTGEQAKELGLVDNFGDVQYVAKEIIKQEEIVEYSIEKSLWEKLMTESVSALTHKLSSIYTRVIL